MNSTLLLCVCCLWTLTSTASAAGYGEEVLADGPIAFWRFDDASSGDGAAARDSSGGHHGTYRGGVILEAGPGRIGGRAARFDGKAAHMSVPDHQDFSTETISVEFWIKSAQVWDRPQWPGSATFISKATAGDGSGDWTINGGSQAAGHNQGLVIASSGAKGGSDQNVASRGAPLNDAVWHHVVWTRSGRGLLRLYIDGRRADRGADCGATIINHREIQIGGDPFLQGTFLEGSLAEAAIYAKVLEPQRVAAHFAAGVDTAQPEVPAAASPRPLEILTLSNDAGLAWELQRFDGGWALGAVRLRGKLAAEPLTGGAILLRRRADGREDWLAAADRTSIDGRTARLCGRKELDGSMVRFQVEVALQPDLPAAAITPSWSADKDLAGWDICMPWHAAGEEEWRCTLYPFAGNAAALDREPLMFCGVPSAILFRPDLSLVTLYGIDPSSDYLDPTTWTGTTGFHFRDGATAPQFRAGGGRMAAGEGYRLPLQLFLSDAGNSTDAITALVKGWIRTNGYRVEPLKVRTSQEGFDLFLRGRRRSRMWKEGKGYQIMENWKVIYTAESPINAWFDYLVYEGTGDPEWRRRAFETVDFMLGAQHRDPKDPHFGAIDTNFELDAGVFNSNDHTANLRFKVDMNSYAARYMLQLWQRVKEKEDIDRQDWYQTAVRIADWVLRQANPDGGLPQVVADDPKRKSISVVSGRSLTAFPVIARITGDARSARFAESLERFLREEAEGRFWFTGAHVDLWPKDFEADSIWHAVEYWIEKHDRTGNPECLRRAEADAWLAFLMWCPKQLPWVKNPTQTCHAEQENFLQYSNYCYNNRKYWCLDRLAKRTRQPLFAELCERIVQCGFWAQATEGDWIGGTYERLSDPWKSVSSEVDSKGQIYVSELALDAALQLLEMGWVKAGGE